MDSTFYSRLEDLAKKSKGRIRNWDASLLTEVLIVLPLYLLVMHMSRRTRKSKESGGAIGLTENPQMLQTWMVAGPELSRVVDEFGGVQNELDELPHHQESRA